jgi:hypothetical protein
MVVYDNHEILAAEEKRLKEDRHRTKYWKKWGSYLAERQWATGSSHPGAFVLFVLFVLWCASTWAWWGVSS